MVMITTKAVIGLALILVFGLVIIGVVVRDEVEYIAER